MIAFILKPGDEGVAIAKICRKAVIGKATCDMWREKYGGLMPSDVKRLNQLEDENQRLKKMFADLSLNKANCEQASHLVKISFCCAVIRSR